jgi:hypothetical protein
MLGASTSAWCIPKQVVLCNRLEYNGVHSTCVLLPAAVGRAGHACWWSAQGAGAPRAGEALTSTHTAEHAALHAALCTACLTVAS